MTESTDEQVSSAREQGSPLQLAAQGSFYVGGRAVHSNALQSDRSGPFAADSSGGITIDQMYVRYMVPYKASGHIPVVMVHGGGLTGACYETTPDGRMGWDEYLVRQGRAVYVADQVGRGRSGVDATIYNEVALGLRPYGDLPVSRRPSSELCWVGFRFGPSFGSSFPDTQYPVEAIGNLWRQQMPDFNANSDPRKNPTARQLATLANQLDGAVLLGHSQSALFPQRAALADYANVRGIVSLETSGAYQHFDFDQRELAVLSRIPLLVIYGDHLHDAAPPFDTMYMKALEKFRALVDAINDSGGDATLLRLPEQGLFGNSHMMMQDKNNLQVADIILTWIDQHVEGQLSPA